MSEVWRRKTYYKPRVLISTERILDPQYDDALLCITGAQLEMLRNLTQYLKRRSTFSQSESDVGYLTPSTADWDTIQAIVADLEETIMGCEEFTALFEDMLAQLQCICQGASSSTVMGPGVPPIIEERLGDGGMQETDDYGPDTVIEAKRCALAQLVYWQAYEWLTEWVQPGQEVAADVMLGVALAGIAVMLGTTVMGIPAATFLVMLAGLADVLVEGSLQDVRNAIWANRQELTCAVWAGLADDYRQAEKLAVEVIEGIGELSPIDKIVMHAMYAPWAIGLAAIAEANATAWALSVVDAGACDDCDWLWEIVYEWPACPGAWSGGFPCYQGKWPGLNASEEGLSPTFTLPSIATNVDINIECRYTSRFGYGFTVGYSQVEYQDVALDWHLIGQNQCTTLQPVGAINTDESTGQDITVPRNVLRLNIHGQPGQGDSDPWPFMPLYMRVRIYPHV